MTAACIVIGVGNYADRSVINLPGAIVDANKVFEVFTSSDFSDYDSNQSQILIDASREEIRSVIAELAYDNSIDAITIFFAGHGGSDNTGYCLCGVDYDPEKIAFSALSLNSIFQILANSPTRQVNIVLDACNAGGLAQDLGVLASNDQMGMSSGVGIAILALSARDEPALEGNDGGVGTNALLDVISGKIDSQSKKEFLSLLDVSEVIQLPQCAQTPSHWSINIQGMLKFCRNWYSLNKNTADVYALPDVIDFNISELSNELRDRIWQAYFSIKNKIDTLQILRILDDVCIELNATEKIDSAIIAIFEGFRERSFQNQDLFGVVQCSMAFLACALKINSKSDNFQYLLSVLTDDLNDVLKNLLSYMEEDNFFLARHGGYSEFYVLPQRISKIAAWALLSCKLTNQVYGNYDEQVEITSKILTNFDNNYYPSYSLMSELQAPAIAIISNLSKVYGFHDWGQNYLSCLYGSYFSCGGKVAQSELENEKVYDFLLHRSLPEIADYENFCAQPTEVMFVLLSHYLASEESEVVRYDFKDLDGVIFNAFIPKDYSDFYSVNIESGLNVGFKIGFEIFTIQEFSYFIDNHVIPKVDILKSSCALEN